MARAALAWPTFQVVFGGGDMAKKVTGTFELRSYMTMFCVALLRDLLWFALHCYVTDLDLRSVVRWFLGPSQVNGYYSPRQNRIGKFHVQIFFLPFAWKNSCFVYNQECTKVFFSNELVVHQNHYGRGWFSSRESEAYHPVLLSFNVWPFVSLMFFTFSLLLARIIFDLWVVYNFCKQRHRTYDPTEVTFLASLTFSSLLFFSIGLCFRTFLNVLLLPNPSRANQMIKQQLKE